MINARGITINARGITISLRGVAINLPGITRNAQGIMIKAKLDQMYKVFIRPHFDYFYHIPHLTNPFESSITLDTLMERIEIIQYQEQLLLLQELGKVLVETNYMTNLARY